MNNYLRKIKVFLSSKCCDNGKYDLVRKEITNFLTKTDLIEVYNFEMKGASTLTAEEHFRLNLKDSDVCIFLIDNADGIPEGVQKEVDIARKENIKSLYYFCDERKLEPLPLQKSLMSAKNSKVSTIHSFNDFSNGAVDLLEDIISIYRFYCNGDLQIVDDSKSTFEMDKYSNWENILVHKSTIANIDRCKNYFRNIIGIEEYEIKKTSSLDEWCYSFLPIMFANKSIKDFNVSMFLEELKKNQEPIHFSLIEKRWKAIQNYYSGNLESSISILGEALAFAKENKVAEWLIKDILIDLRNLSATLANSKDEIMVENPAQQELDKSKIAIYYPLMDRMIGDLNQSYLREKTKDELQSPYTITFGHTINQTYLIANIYVIAMFNGSLTHLLLLHKYIKELAFFLSEKYEGWHFRKMLYQETLYESDSKEIEGVERLFPDILTKINDKEAFEIYKYCDNQPVQYKRIFSKLHAFGAIGYYLNDVNFEAIFKEIKNIIDSWLENNDCRIRTLGNSILNCLNKISYRIDPNTIINITISFLNLDSPRYYNDVFRLISSSVDINLVEEKKAREFINIIIGILDNKDCSTYSMLKLLLVNLRKQNKVLTEQLDLKISEKIPNFYKGDYLLETTDDSTHNLETVKKYIKNIYFSNKNQGKNGILLGGLDSSFAVIKNIFSLKEIRLEEVVEDDLINAICETLVLSNQNIEIKCDAVDLMLYLLNNYPHILERNLIKLSNLLKNEESLYNYNFLSLSSKISKTALMFSFSLLKFIIKKKNSLDLLKVIPFIQDDIPTKNRVCKTMMTFLESSSSLVDANIQSIFLQTILNWLYDDNVDVRWNCVQVLIMLSKNKEVNEIINYQLIRLIDSDNVFVKNKIQNMIFKYDIDKDTVEYIKSKCKNDSHYMVRKVYAELNH